MSYNAVGYAGQLNLVGNRRAALAAQQNRRAAFQAALERQAGVARPGRGRYSALAAIEEAEAIAEMQAACPPGPYGMDVVVDERPYTKAGRRPLGFPATSVAAGVSSGPIVSQPQKPFKPTRLVIPSSIAGLFVVTSLQIGNDEMLMNGNPVPALAFNENTEDGWLNLETAQISQNISVTVTNISGAAATFYGMLFGTMVRT